MPREIDRGFYTEFKRTPKEEREAEETQNLATLMQVYKQMSNQINELTERVRVLEESIGKGNR